MFAYCGNDPVNHSDPEGLRWISLLVQRIIHHKVANQVALKVGGKRETYVKKQTAKGKRSGFLDVYVPKNNSYYEIKSETDSTSSRTRQQMMAYDNAEIVYNGNSSPSRGTEVVSGEFSYLYYDVSYKSEGPGLVTYHVDENEERKREYEAVAATTLCAALAVVAVAAAPELVVVIAVA